MFERREAAGRNDRLLLALSGGLGATTYAAAGDPILAAIPGAAAFSGMFLGYLGRHGDARVGTSDDITEMDERQLRRALIRGDLDEEEYRRAVNLRRADDGARGATTDTQDPHDGGGSVFGTGGD